MSWITIDLSRKFIMHGRFQKQGKWVLNNSYQPQLDSVYFARTQFRYLQEPSHNKPKNIKFSDSKRRSQNSNSPYYYRPNCRMSPVSQYRQHDIYHKQSFRKLKDDSVNKSREKLSQTLNGFGSLLGGQTLRERRGSQKELSEQGHYLSNSFSKTFNDFKHFRVNSNPKFQDTLRSRYDLNVLKESNKKSRSKFIQNPHHLSKRLRQSPSKHNPDCTLKHRKAAESPSQRLLNESPKKEHSAYKHQLKANNIIQKLLKKYQSPRYLPSPLPVSKSRQKLKPQKLSERKKSSQKIAQSPSQSHSAQKNFSPSKNLSNSKGLSPLKAESKPCKRQFGVNDFLRIKLLGAGKFGKVYLVVQKQTGCLFAMKSIKKSMVVEYDMQVQLARQIKIQMFLNHNNIVKVFAFFDDQAFVYLLEQLGQRGQLYKHLKTAGKFAQAQALNYVSQVLSALIFMHDHRIIHRDIKPQNIVLQGDQAKLVDFGWAVMIEGQNRSTFCGTPEYVCPQIVKGQDYDQCTDSWALGVLAFELLFGKSPFSVDKEKQMGKIVKQKLVIPKEVQVSEQAKDFIRKLLEKERGRRMTTFEAAKHPWLAKCAK